MINQAYNPLFQSLFHIALLILCALGQNGCFVQASSALHCEEKQSMNKDFVAVVIWVMLRCSGVRASGMLVVTDGPCVLLLDR